MPATHADARFILCEEVNEVYQSVDDDDDDADDSLATEAAELQTRRQDWLSQIDFTKSVFISALTSLTHTHVSFCC